ncbi:MAG TPA: hypothetical protein VLU46_08070 [Thermoanaerobaculia bacterium]|nr:hypothetical protein [Thermoanaerobaculia bacterium]
MARRNLLPGVSADGCPPAVVIDSRRVIARARWRAVAGDIAQFVLLAGIDALFVRWPYAHVPALDRETSVLIVAALNALLITQALITRTFPRWSARRIAGTWCLAERARFFAESRREQAAE